MNKKDRYVEIDRISKTDHQCLGIWTIFDQHGFPFFECRTVELPDRGNKRRISCIPEGEYWVVKRKSAKYGPHFHFLHVPNRSLILAHNANYVEQLLGCVAVGLAHTDINGDGYRDVTRSKQTLKDLNRELPDRFKLKIYAS